MRFRPSFPPSVNTAAARFVAASVVVLAVAWLVTGRPMFGLVLVGGFVLRVLWGPRFDPIGYLASAAARRLAVGRPTAGTPKRFAQGVGFTFSSVGVALQWAGQPGWTVVVGGLAAAASLEAACGLCLGCRFHEVLVAAGVAKPCATCVGP